MDVCFDLMTSMLSARRQTSSQSRGMPAVAALVTAALASVFAVVAGPAVAEADAARIVAARLTYTYPNYEIRVHLHIRACGHLGRYAILVREFRSPYGRDHPITARNVRRGYDQQTRFCQSKVWSWTLPDKFAGIGRYRVRARVRTRGGEYGRAVNLREDTED